MKPLARIEIPYLKTTDVILLPIAQHTQIEARCLIVSKSQAALLSWLQIEIRWVVPSNVTVNINAQVFNRIDIRNSRTGTGTTTRGINKRRIVSCSLLERISKAH